MKKGKPAAKFKKRAGAKAVKAFEREVGASDKLGSNDATTFRAISARSNYLAQDRPDGSYSGKELCREFGQPNGQSLVKLKRLGRYYAGKPRLVYRYDFAHTPAEYLEVYCDTDFAITRRSTSGGCAMVGGALVKHWSKTQSTIALSSGEAELSGIGAGMAQALGMQALAADMGWSLKPRVHSDATAAIGNSNVAWERFGICILVTFGSKSKPEPREFCSRRFSVLRTLRTYSQSTWTMLQWPRLSRR